MPQMRSEDRPDPQSPERVSGELDGFLLILYPALLMVIAWIEAWSKRGTDQDLREFLLVVRRAMLMVTSWIARRCDL
jgi:hypothetical protein